MTREEQILESLRLRGVLNLQGLARETGMPKATVANLLWGMLSKKIINRRGTQRNYEYSIGPGLATHTAETVLELARLHVPRSVFDWASRG